MRLIRLPGVFRPRSDTWMLARALRSELGGKNRATVLDVCTGSGALALTAAEAGADATAIDVSRRSVATVKLNAALRRLRVRALRGDLFAPVSGRRFDVIVTNPPYVPSEDDRLPERGASRAWEGGSDGRILLDRICAEAPGHLNEGGALLIVQSSLSGTDATLDALRAAGLSAGVIDRHTGPLGPLMRARAADLERRGLLEPGQREEEMVVVRAQRPAE